MSRENGDAGSLEPDTAAQRIRELNRESIQTRTFEVFYELVSKLAEERPLCLVLEDLHWADESTLDLLEHLRHLLLVQHMGEVPESVPVTEERSTPRSAATTDCSSHSSTSLGRRSSEASRAMASASRSERAPTRTSA